MSQSVSVNFAQKFRADYMLLSQQKTSRFRPFVRDDPDSLSGKYGHFNRIGATEMVKNTTRHADTPLVEQDHSRRRVSMDDWDWADLIDRQDIMRVMGNPQNSYVRNAVMAAMRNEDKIILAAANGTAYSIDEDDAATGVALPSSQQIAASSTGLTLAKMIETLEILNAAEAADEDSNIVFAYSAKQVTDLLGITEFKSADFNSGKPPTTGLRVGGNFLGFTLVRSELLTKSGSDRKCLAWTQDAIGIALGEELFVDIGPRRDKRMSEQVYVAQTMGAVRVEDAKVVEISCQE